MIRDEASTKTGVLLSKASEMVTKVKE